MRPLRGRSRLLEPLVESSALLTARAPGPGGPSGPRTPTSAPPGESILTDAALPRLPLARFLPGAAGRPDRLTDWQDQTPISARPVLTSPRDPRIRRSRAPTAAARS
jgi:hypothetical protein